jgi:hypothetical protein
MLALFVRLNRFAAAGCAVAITAVNAWAFVASSASTDRDPFHFESVMTSNAELHTAEVHGAEAHTAQAHSSSCWTELMASARLPSGTVAVCQRG